LAVIFIYFYFTDICAIHIFNKLARATAKSELLFMQRRRYRYRYKQLKIH